MKQILLIVFTLLISGLLFSCNKKYDQKKYRIIVSTDIGGTDFDDYQSLAHLLVYADTIDLEGIISSPYGDGRVKHIFEGIDAYEKDYPNLKSASEDYPTPDAIRAIIKQGATEIPNLQGYDKPTEGSEWIIKCAKKDDPRPLNVLIWGGIEDLAQALHDAPEILPKLRVHFIGGPNKKWSVNAYQYIVENFPNLWMIESNATYRGWFVGGNQKGDLENKAFVEKHIKNYGALGKYFYSKGGTIKMGDTPTLAYWLNGNPDDPTTPSWGGQYVRAWDRPHKIFNRTTTLSDSLEEFGVLELQLPYNSTVENPWAKFNVGNQKIKAEVKSNVVRFLFSPKKAGEWNYNITSNIPELENKTGQLWVFQTPVEDKNNPSDKYPNWWVDDPSPEYKEKGHIGIKTVNCWREEFLADFARRMKRCSSK